MNFKSKWNFALLLSLFALVSLSSCRHRLETAKVLIVPCRLPELPDIKAVEFSGEGKGCPPEYAVCLDKENSVILQYDITVLTEYAIEADTRCGSQADAGYELDYSKNL